MTQRNDMDARVPGSVRAEPVLGTEAALAEERAALGLGPGEQATALCLSGGGIRSAAFCLGVIQALAQRRLLGQFHYLSSVSGGGYIAAWLTRLIAQRSLCDPGRPALDSVEAEIGARGGTVEPEPLRNLRRYTNYLTPNPGPLSLDTWAGILLWLRNTLVNWLVFLPVFGAVASLPIAYLAAVCAAVAWLDEDVRGGLAVQAALVGAVFLLAAAFAAIIHLPSYASRDTPRGRAEPAGFGSGAVFVRIVVPIVLWCLFAPLAAAPHVHLREAVHDGHAVFGAAIPWSDAAASPAPVAPPRILKPGMMVVPAASFGACLVAYWAAFLVIRRRYPPGSRERREHTEPFIRSTPAWLASSALSALLLLYGLWLAQNLGIFWIVLAGPPWVCLAEILRTTLYVALRREGLRSDSDREWLARVNGAKLLVLLGMALGGAVAVLGGLHLAEAQGFAWSAIVGGGVASGGIAAVIGRSAQTAFMRRLEGRGRIPIGWLLRAAIAVFGLVLLAAIGRGVARGAGWAAELASGTQAPAFVTLTLCTAAIGLVLALLALGLGWVINLNRFSMHAVYRNRLIRAFLGSGRPEGVRRPDRFTDFDPADNIRVADAFTARVPPRLFPVINVALNRTSGKDTARAERKAEPFTITPFRCGAATLARPGAAPRSGAYAATAAYARGERDTGPDDLKKGISLGTAITISGAAASPNMGYHSSPLIAFVMTLFNVRLGAWLPNPALRRDSPEEIARTLSRSGPPNEVPTLLNELIGRSDSRGDFLYLSDGGHFDNLGLYEMLRRQCRLIVVVDAGQDKDYAYEDLARVKQHARIDLGVEIDFLQPIRTGASALSPQGALAAIQYPAGEGGGCGPRGHLLYIKSWLPQGAPIELLTCRTRRVDFPHESTGNQFFTESDFESYRRLGEHLARTVIEAAVGQTACEGGNAADLGGLFEALERLSQRGLCMVPHR